MIKLYSFLIIVLISSCAPRDTFTSKAYHNLTSKYNAYFLAREKMKEVELDVFKNRKENFNKILEVFPTLDTNSLQQYDKKMEDCIEKAALIPNNHSNSNFVDRAYVLVGKSRFYLRDYKQAQIAFKYVNSKGKDENAKDYALIELMNTFMFLNQMPEARTIMGYLSKREKNMDKGNASSYNLSRANYYRKQDDYKRTGKYLVLAKEKMTRGEKKGRVYFILGQIYQMLGINDKSYTNYKKVLKNNPNYDLTFYSKLYMVQLSKTGEDRKKVKRIFRRMLRDEKNKDYKDKIYYEMALFELKNNNIDGIKDTRKPDKTKHKGAIELLQKSVKVSKNNLQKAYSFLKLGEIHYNYKKDFERAKIDYDSVIAFYPTSEKSFKTHQKRQKILEEFVKQLNKYRLEDSLQSLAKMPKGQLETYLDSIFYQQELNKLKAERERILLAERQKEIDIKKSISSLPKEEKAKLFYFNNPVLVSKGKKAFTKKWGDRPLEDNWRRKNKEGGIGPDNDTSQREEEAPALEVLAKQNADALKESLKKKLPYSRVDLNKSNEKMEKASYKLGKIYAQKLNEPQNAITQFQSLLKRFPRTKHEPEALYYLWFLSNQLKKDGQASNYETKLKTKYPDSIFAKLIDDPNYLKKLKAEERIVRKEYGKAYKMYELEKYTQVQTLLTDIAHKYPHAESLDKVYYLKALTIGRLSGKKALVKALEVFVANKKFRNSPLLKEAKELLKEAK